MTEGLDGPAPPKKQPLLSAGVLALLSFGVHFVSTAVFFGMFIKIVPVFEKMFAEVGAELPFLTRVLISLADFMAGFGLALFPVVALVLALDAGLLFGLVRFGRARELGLVLAGSLTICPLFVIFCLLGCYLPIYAMPSTVGALR